MPSLAALQVAKYMRAVKQCAWAFKEYSLEKIVFHFLDANFFAPKSGHQWEKQPVLGPELIKDIWSKQFKSLKIAELHL